MFYKRKFIPDWLTALGIVVFVFGICIGFGVLAAHEDKTPAEINAPLVLPAEPTAPAYIPIPRLIDVNGIEWRVVLVDDMGSLNGLTDCSTRVILVVRDGRGERRQTILMHELSHALVCNDSGFWFHPNNMYFNSSSNEEHEGIYRFSTVWSEVLLRNPTLGPYLSQLEE